MNRHKVHWSAMHDADQCQSQQSKDYENLRVDLNKMVDRFGFDDVVTELRKIYERMNE